MTGEIDATGSSDGDVYSDRRQRLYRMFYEEYITQYVHYTQYYLASDELEKWSKRLDYITTIVGAILLLLIGGLVTNQVPAWGDLVAFVLSTIVTTLSFVDSIGDYDSRAVKYHVAAQRHDDLFSEFNYLIEVRFPDPDEDLDELESDCMDLIDRRKELQRNTPTISQRWFEKLQERRDIHWDRPALHEVKEHGIESW